jgi:hypothetical protein
LKPPSSENNLQQRTPYLPFAAGSKEEAESLFWDGKANLEWKNKDDDLEITECDED